MRSPIFETNFSLSYRLYFVTKCAQSIVEVKKEV